MLLHGLSWEFERWRQKAGGVLHSRSGWAATSTSDMTALVKSGASLIGGASANGWATSCADFTYPLSSSRIDGKRAAVYIYMNMVGYQHIILDRRARQRLLRHALVASAGSAVA